MPNIQARRTPRNAAAMTTFRCSRPTPLPGSYSLWLVAGFFWFLPSFLIAQGFPPLDGREGRGLLLENFRPRPMLKVAEHPLTHAKFPVVDVHTHFRDKFHGSA